MDRVIEWVTGLMIIGLVAFSIMGCGPMPRCRFVGDIEVCETRRCRDAKGRFTKCPLDCERFEELLRRPGLHDETRANIGKQLDACRGHGDPVGADMDGAGFFRCRDADGITWESHGECD